MFSESAHLPPLNPKVNRILLFIWWFFYLIKKLTNSVKNHPKSPPFDRVLEAVLAIEGNQHGEAHFIWVKPFRLSIARSLQRGRQTTRGIRLGLFIHTLFAVTDQRPVRHVS